MDLDGSKHQCGICKNWEGRREFVGGMSRVKSSARGQCVLLKTIKPPHGGCNQWEKWDGKDLEKQ
jgi:hypothetical protein